MKNTIKYISILVLIAFTSFSCTDDFENINTDPYAISASKADMSGLLKTVQYQLAGDCNAVWHWDLSIASPMMQHVDGAWYCAQGSQYKLMEAPSHWWELWDKTYPREVKSIISLVKATDGKADKTNINSMARIMKVYVFQKLTDAFGDIPYSEVGQVDIGNYTPKYDKQEDIYNDFFKELDEATAALDSEKDVVLQDMFYDGDVESWKKFANSLRLRLAMRLHKINPTKAKAEVVKAVNGGLISSNMELAKVKYENEAYVDDVPVFKGNGYAQTYNREARSASICLSKTLVDHLKETNDPRLLIYGGTYTGGEFNGVDLSKYYQEGMRQGGYRWCTGGTTLVDQADLSEDAIEAFGQAGWSFDDDGIFDASSQTWSGRFFQLSKYMAQLDNPYFHITYSEVEYLLAEAVLRGYIAGDAKTHYENAAKASISIYRLVSNVEKDGLISDAIVDQYVADNPWPATTEEQYKIIGEQLWVLFFQNGVEAFSSWRRLGYPELNVFSGVEWYSATETSIPRRMLYPKFESLNNGENYNEAITNMGGTDSWLNRVWWDKQ